MVQRGVPAGRRSDANPDLERYVNVYADIERDYREAVGAFGLEWEPDEASFTFADLRARASTLAEKGAVVENNFGSIRAGWISPSCVACRTGVGTETFLASTQCPRNCYFCFNPNQADYAYYLDHVHDMAAELQQRFDAGVRHTDLAVTGGEPLMHRRELMAFLKRARELRPEARVRLYTSGAGLDEGYAREIADAGVDEIRFSVKLDDAPDVLRKTMERLSLCTRIFPDAMVEMPVMPDRVEDMKALIAQLDEAGCRGINLLELCFPLHNAEEFARRGYRLKARPYRVLYDYWYSGGLPVAGSEQACLDLLDWALDSGISMGVHYCSLENKLTGQVYQQNRFIPVDHPFHEMSPRDYFLKSAKVFGTDCAVVERILTEAGIERFQRNEAWRFLEFPPSLVPRVTQAAPDAQILICSAIAEMRDGEPALREVALEFAQ